MKTISNSLNTLLQSQPFIEEAMLSGIVNFSALAKHLNPQVNSILKREVKSEAIMMALRRYKLPHSIQKTSKLNFALKHLGPLTVRSNLTDYTFKNSESLVSNNAKVLTHIYNKTQVFYAFTGGIHESNLVISSQESAFVDTYFKSEYLITKEGDLSAISLELPKGNSSISGLYYSLFKRLAWYSIPVYEVVSTTNEFTILIENQYIDQAFTAIKQLIQL